MISLIEKIRAGNDLSAFDVQEAAAFLLSESIEAKTKADFLTALHDKGESASEIASFVRVLLERAVPLEIEADGPIVDVCGTGGDGIDLFNVAIDLEPDDLRECIKRLGCGFVFARTYHPAFRALAEMRLRLARKQQRTIFNLLGPLLNPARPKRQLIGVFSPHLTMLFADVLRRLDCERAWIVSGTAVDSLTMDDVSTIGPTVIAEVNSGKITSAVLDTRWLGIPQATLPELTGGDARTNAETIMRILAGGETGPKHDLVIANAAAGFVVSGLASEMNGGIAMAREQIESGRALEKLKALQNFVA